MKAKIHALQVEIKTIEKLMDSLNNQMQQLALEEVKNLRFELDTLNRAASLKTNSPQFPDKAIAGEAVAYA
jgi:hypothetical protein